MALFLIKIKENVWINPDKITFIYYDKGKVLTIYLADGNEYSFYDKDADELVTLLHDYEVFFK